MDDVVFRAEFVPGQHVVALTGELDLLSAWSLSDALEMTVDTEPFVVDCSELQFIDFSGLRVLLAEHERRAARGGSLTVRNPPPVMRRLMEVTESTFMLEDSAQLT